MNLNPGTAMLVVLTVVLPGAQMTGQARNSGHQLPSGLRTARDLPAKPSGKWLSAMATAGWHRGADYTFKTVPCLMYRPLRRSVTLSTRPRHSGEENL